MSTITGNGNITRVAANVDTQNPPATFSIGNLPADQASWFTIGNDLPWKNKGNVNQTLTISNVVVTGAALNDAQIYVGGQPKGASFDLPPSELAVVKVQVTTPAVTPYKPGEPQTVPVTLTFDYLWS